MGWIIFWTIVILLVAFLAWGAHLSAKQQAAGDKWYAERAAKLAKAKMERDRYLAASGLSQPTPITVNGDRGWLGLADSGVRIVV